MAKKLHSRSAPTISAAGKKGTGKRRNVPRRTPGPARAKSLDWIQIRAWWAACQGLDREQRHSAEKVLEQCGWARSVAGSGPYLTFFSRAGLSRSAVDAELAAQKIHELPAARGCTYIVPAGDFGLALKVGAEFGFPQEMRVAAKLGVTDKEVDRLCDKVLQALARAALDPDEIRASVGTAARSLGPEGKKKGMTTTLPLALGRLQSLGEIRRIPQNGRLDQQRYRYEKWKQNPLTRFRLDKDQSFAELARRYFRWIGPATLEQFRTFAGLGIRAAEQAVADLKLEKLSLDEELLILPDQLDSLLSYRVPESPHFVLVSGLDSMLSLRRSLTGLVEPRDQGTEVLGEREKTGLGTLSDLSDHAIFDRGRLVGLWLFDAATSKIVWVSWVKASTELKRALSRTEQFIAADLGDVRMFSLDSPKSRQARVDFLQSFKT